MARFNEIQVGRLNRFLQKFTGIKGSVPAPQLSSDIQSQIVVPSGVENRYLESFDKFFVSQFIGPFGAGNNAAFMLRNLPGSNQIGVIEKITVSSTTVSAGLGVTDVFVVQMGQITSDFSSDQTAQIGFYDPRLGTHLAGRSGFHWSVNTAGGAVIIGTTFRVWQQPSLTDRPNDVILTDNDEFPLLPGDGVAIASLNVNNSLLATVHWRQRFLEESERN